MALAAISLALFAGCKPTDKGGDGTSGGSSGNNQAATGDTINIGLVCSQNGDLRPWGQDSLNGATLAIEEFNAKNLLGGKKVVLSVEDSNSKPEEGKSAAEKLASNGVLCLIGEVASGITIQMKDVALENGIPLVAVGATKPEITKDGKGLISRVCYNDDLQGPVMAVFAWDKGLRRIAVMTDNKQPYSQGLSKTFKDKFIALGGQIVAEEFYQSGENQFGSQITNIKSKNPDGIFMSGYFNEVGPMARQIRDSGMKTQVLLGGDGWDSKDIMISGGNAIIGGFYCNHYHNDEDRPVVKEFLSKFKAKYNDIPGTTMGALGYDATMLVCDALARMTKDGKPYDSKTLAEYIDNTEGFPGVSGDITLKGMNGDPLKRALVVSVQKDGFKFEKAYEASEVTSR